MQGAVRHSDLDSIWDKVYANAATEDFEVDRLSPFLDRLYREDREFFASFLCLVTGDATRRFHEHKEKSALFFDDPRELSFDWNGKKLVPVKKS
jgi:hypothetical protein